jgi:hypothetical protein
LFPSLRPTFSKIALSESDAVKKPVLKVVRLPNIELPNYVPLKSDELERMTSSHIHPFKIHNATQNLTFKDEHGNTFLPGSIIYIHEQQINKNILQPPIFQTTFSHSTMHLPQKHVRFEEIYQTKEKIHIFTAWHPTLQIRILIHIILGEHLVCWKCNSLALSLQNNGNGELIIKDSINFPSRNTL